MLDYRLVEAFGAVIEERGFARAAQRLCITQSAVSQRIRQLEDQLGRVLVLREAPPRPTPAGERLLRHYRQVAGLEEEAILDLGIPREGGFRHLPIAVNADCLSVWLLDAMAPFLREAAITLEIYVGDQDNNLHFLQSGLAAGCVSSQRMVVPGFTSTRIGTVRYLMCAAPAFAAQWFPDGFERAAAARAPIIQGSREDQLNHRSLRKRFGTPQVAPPAHYVPTTEQYNEAVRLGLGYAMVPEAQALPEIRAGRVLELDVRARLDTPLYWYRWNRATDLLLEFSKLLVGRGRRVLAATLADGRAMVTGSPGRPSAPAGGTGTASRTRRPAGS
jgi:LysR family transcriptional regulator (chromosome initiation inhibitor)